MEAATISRSRMILPRSTFNRDSTPLRSEAKLISPCLHSWETSNKKSSVARGLRLSISRPVPAKLVGRAFSSAVECAIPAGDTESDSGTKKEKIGLMLMNLGGPETLLDVQPFFFNLFANPVIIILHRFLGFLLGPLAQLIWVLISLKSKQGYAAIGGPSALHEITHEQAKAIKIALQAKEVPASVYVARRYWHRSTLEVVHQIKRDGITRLVVLPLHHHHSISTTGSSIRVLQGMFRNDACFSRVSVVFMESWYERVGYIKSMADLIEKELQTFPNPEETMIFFNVSYVENGGDPYRCRYEMEECMFLIMQELKSRGIQNDHTLAYQSRVGPVQWLKPYTYEALVELGKQGVKSLLAVPVRFVSENMETLEEMGMKHKELALESGIINWGCVSALNFTSLMLINYMADAVIEELPSAMAVASTTSLDSDNWRAIVQL